MAEIAGGQVPVDADLVQIGVRRITWERRHLDAFMAAAFQAADGSMDVKAGLEAVYHLVAPELVGEAVESFVNALSAPLAEGGAPWVVIRAPAEHLYVHPDGSGEMLVPIGPDLVRILCTRPGSHGELWPDWFLARELKGRLAT